MPTQVKYRRGTTAEHSTFTGAVGEMTIDTTKNTCVVHDGSTIGGHPLATAADLTVSQGDITSLQGDMTTAQGDITSLESRPRKNFLINGNLDLWQRGTSQTATFYGSADRWFFFEITNVSRSTDVPSGSTYSVKITPTAVGSINMRQVIEGGEQFLAGKQCTLSFWAKADSSRTITSDFFDEVGSAKLHTLTTTWQKFTHTHTLTSGVNPFFDFENHAANTVPYYITQVQLEIGDAATDFEYRPIGEELALCQRYYCKSYNLDIYPGVASDFGRVQQLANTNGTHVYSVDFPVMMRAAPSVTVFSPATGASGKLRDATSGDLNVNVFQIGHSRFVVSAGGGTADASGQIQFTADAEL